MLCHPPEIGVLIVSDSFATTASSLPGQTLLPVHESATSTLAIEGMTCASCVSRVERALKEVSGVASASINLTTGMASVRTGGGIVPEEALVQAVKKAGYGATVLDRKLSAGAALQTIAKRSQRGQDAIRLRLLVGIFFGILTMVGDWPLIQAHMAPSHPHPGVDWGGLLTACFATVVVCCTGRFFFINAWRAKLHPTMDTLVALGAGAAYLTSMVGVVINLVGGHVGGGTMHSEFHAAVTIIVLVTLGKYLEARAKAAANAAVAGLAQQSAQTAMILRPDEAVETVPAERVAIGDRVQVLAHQTVPVDGELIAGAGALDTAIVTGETRPVELRLATAGDGTPPPVVRVPGGSTLVDGRIVIKATSTAAGSTVARILEMVQNAQSSKTRIQGLADRVAAVFTPIVLLLALLTLGGWLLLGSGGWVPGLSAAIATIVIACPCALGLATPTAITVGMARAARLGILFTNAGALEQAGGGGRGRRESGASTASPLPGRAGNPQRGIATVCFDKTGTLTTGQFRVVGVVLGPAANLDGGELLRLAANLEQFSTHPLAQTIVAEATRRGLALAEPESFSSIPGGGIRGQIHGEELVIGSPEWLGTLGVVRIEGLAGRMQSQGASLVGIARVPADSATPVLLGVIGLADTLRPDAAATIAELRRQGIQVGVISGDTAEAVRGALAEIPVDFVLAGVQPEEKAQAVAALREGNGVGGENYNANMPNGGPPTPVRHGTPSGLPGDPTGLPGKIAWRPGGVMFVGDGVNDGPALAAADLGAALGGSMKAGVGGGSDLARAAGDVILLSDRLGAVPEAIMLARHTMAVIRQNLFWAFFYNMLALPLAMLGQLPPSWAAGAMVLSSLCVVGNALRLYRVKLEMGS